MLVEIERQDDICVLRLSGRLVVSRDLTYLRDKAEEIKACNSGKVLADLQGASYLDSTALGFLVGIYSSVTKNPGGRFVMVSPNARVREVLDITRLSTVIPTAADFTSGLAVLRAGA